MTNIFRPRRALLALLVLHASQAGAQDIALKSNEVADVTPVYWISNCKSILKRFDGAEVLLGPPQLTAVLKEEQVAAKRQNCADKVPGAMLQLKAGEVTAPFEGTVRVRVRYRKEDGDKQSVHSVKVPLVPK